MTVDAQHVLEGELSVQLRFGLAGARPLPDTKGAAISAQLAGDEAIDRKESAVGSFASDYRRARLKLITIARGLRFCRRSYRSQSRLILIEDNPLRRGSRG